MDLSDRSRSIARAKVAPEPQTTITWHRQLLERILPPPSWNGTSREWRALAAAVANNCTCTSRSAQSVRCAAHRLLEDSARLNRLLYVRRMARRLQHQEFALSFKAVTSYHADDRDA
jgi:hypothetical protein